MCILYRYIYMYNVYVYVVVDVDVITYTVSKMEPITQIEQNHWKIIKKQNSKFHANNLQHE